MLPTQSQSPDKGHELQVVVGLHADCSDEITHLTLQPADRSHVLRTAYAVPVRGQELPGLHWRHWGSCHG